MEPTKENPIYTLCVVSDSTEYNLSECFESISFSDQKKQFSKSAQIDIVNTQVNGTWLSSIIKERDRVFVFANDGETKDEVWRGFVWKVSYKSSLNDRLIYLQCYDNLIYYQESEESEYFSSGKSTEDIAQSLCNKWGVKLEYTYSSITHSKLPLRGTLSDIFISDLLEPVRERTGEKYVILSERDVMKIKSVGQNATVYKILAGQNAIQTRRTRTMDGMITKVVILGKADDNDRRPVEATVSGDTDKYGTLQKLKNRDENTSLADAKKEANSIIKENGKPKIEYEVTAPDIPWIRKGDKVEVSAGDLVGTYIVTDINRDISNREKKMTLTMEDV